MSIESALEELEDPKAWVDLLITDSKRYIALGKRVSALEEEIRGLITVVLKEQAHDLGLDFEAIAASVEQAYKKK